MCCVYDVVAVFCGVYCVRSCGVVAGRLWAPTTYWWFDRCAKVGKVWPQQPQKSCGLSAERHSLDRCARISPSEFSDWLHGRQVILKLPKILGSRPLLAMTICNASHAQRYGLIWLFLHLLKRFSDKFRSVI